MACTAAAFAHAQTPAPTPPATGTAPAADPKADGSYSLGVTIGNQLRNTGLTAENVALDRILAGLKDGLGGKAQGSAAHNESVNRMIVAARTEAGARNQETARKFFDANGKKKGVVTTKSGLQYRVVAAGKGEAPKPTDQVTVHYRGTLLDGTEFDSSYKRGEPTSFPLNGVIPCWTEGVQQMKVGGKSRLVCPSAIAYGERGAPPDIGPGATLIFDVELLAIEAPAAAAAPTPAH